MTEAAIDFATYGTKSSGDRSGAYLFLPDGPAVVGLPYTRAVLNIRGADKGQITTVGKLRIFKYIFTVEI